MARFTRKKVKAPKQQTQDLLRKEFEDSLGTVDVLGKDCPVAMVMRTFHPMELKMRYLKFLEDRGVSFGPF